MFDEKTVSIPQKKLAQSFIDSVVDGLQLDNPPNYLIMGLNSDEQIAKLEFQKFEENEKEIKKIDKEIKSIQNFVNGYVKVIFDLDRNPKKLVCKSDTMKTSKAFTPRFIWAGVLDFPITRGIIFGRVCNIQKHGGGKYYFGTFEKLESKLTENIGKLEEMVPELFPYEIIEMNNFIDFLGNFKYVTEVKDRLRIASDKLKLKSSGLTTFLVNRLNHHKELIKSLKKIPHFGTTEYLFYKFVSKIDVSTLFIPYKEVTYFHIDQFGFPPKKEFRAIITLLNELEKFPKSAEDKSAEKKERFMKLEKRRKTEQIICNFLMKNKGKAFTKYSLNKRCLELQQLGLEIDEIEDISKHLNFLGKIGLDEKEYEIFYYIR